MTEEKIERGKYLLNEIEHLGRTIHSWDTATEFTTVKFRTEKSCDEPLYSARCLQDNFISIKDLMLHSLHEKLVFATKEFEEL